MGNYQTKVINILVQDDEFDDIFTKYMLSKTYTNVKWYEYVVGGSSKFKNDALTAKEILLKYMRGDRANIPHLLTNGNGKVDRNSAEYNMFKDAIRTDLAGFQNTDGFNIQMVLTGQSAQFINIMSELLSSKNGADRFLTPANIELILVNGKHNGKNLYTSLNKMTKICNTYNITLVIREFNSFSSMGEGIKQWVEPADSKFINCGTTDNFVNKLYDLTKKNNKLADCIIQYGLKFNSSIISKTVQRITDAIEIMNNINFNECSSWDIQTLDGDVSKYINNLITTTDNISKLDVDLCQKLALDLGKVLNCAETQIKRIDEDLVSGDITIELANRFRKKLYSIRGYFRVKVEIAKCNLLHFPLHDLSAFLIMTQNANLTPFDSHAVRFGEFMNITKDPSKNGNSFPVIHYVAQNPEATRTYMEELVLNIIETYI